MYNKSKFSPYFLNLSSIATTIKNKPSSRAKTQLANFFELYSTQPQAHQAIELLDPFAIPIKLIYKLQAKTIKSLVT